MYSYECKICSLFCGCRITALCEFSKLRIGFRLPSPAPFLDMKTCACLKEFMREQRDVISRHLDEHKYLRRIADKEEAVSSFVNDYGFLIREIYCSRICEKRQDCEIAEKMRKRGDLLEDHLKK